MKLIVSILEYATGVELSSFEERSLASEEGNRSEGRLEETVEEMAGGTFVAE